MSEYTHHEDRYGIETLKGIRVIAVPELHKESCEGCVLDKHPEQKSGTGIPPVTSDQYAYRRDRCIAYRDDEEKKRSDIKRNVCADTNTIVVYDTDWSKSEYVLMRMGVKA